MPMQLVCFWAQLTKSKTRFVKLTKLNEHKFNLTHYKAQTMKIKQQNKRTQCISLF